jgi:hypothetical protein
MVRMLLLVIAAGIVVLVTLSIIKTLAWLALFFIICAGLVLLIGALRLGRRSGRRLQAALHRRASALNRRAPASPLAARERRQPMLV